MYIHRQQRGLSSIKPVYSSSYTLFTKKKHFSNIQRWSLKSHASDITCSSSNAERYIHIIQMDIEIMTIPLHTTSLSPSTCIIIQYCDPFHNNNYNIIISPHLIDFGWGEIFRPFVSSPLDDVSAGPPSIVVLSTVPVLPPSREELDRWEALDAIATGHDRVNGGIYCTQFDLSFEFGGGRRPMRSQVLAVTTPITSMMGNRVNVNNTRIIYSTKIIFFITYTIEPIQNVMQQNAIQQPQRKIFTFELWLTLSIFIFSTT